MFGAIDRWLKRQNSLPVWVNFGPTSVTAIILYITVFSSGLTSGLTIWQKILLYAVASLVSSLVWTVALDILGARARRKKKAEELRNAWDKFLESEIMCGELELYTSYGTIRGFITRVGREGDEICFSRNWVAERMTHQWLYRQSDAGTDFSISAIDGKGPISRADDTYFIDLPGVGAAVVYPANHPGLLKLKLSVSLEQPETVTA